MKTGWDLSKEYANIEKPRKVELIINHVGDRGFCCVAVVNIHICILCKETKLMQYDRQGRR